MTLDVLIVVGEGRPPGGVGEQVEEGGENCVRYVHVCCDVRRAHLRADDVRARPRWVGLVPAGGDHGGLHPGVVDGVAGRDDGVARGARLRAGRRRRGLRGRCRHDPTGGRERCH